MTYKFDGYNYLVRLKKGERLQASVITFIKEQKIQGGWVTGIGGACWAEVGFYHLDKNVYTWQKLEQSLEIVSLNGNIAWDGDDPFVHLHGCFSSDDMKTYSGHVKEAEISGTCELFIHVWNKDNLHRLQDDETGLKLLDI